VWGWQVHQLGNPADALIRGEIPDPEPGPGQVLVRLNDLWTAGEIAPLVGAELPLR
jgi:hypothetical protein